MKTYRGIYYDLYETEYYFEEKNTGFILYFSSSFYLEKFKREYESYVNGEILKLNTTYKTTEFNSLFIYKILVTSIYKKIEKRGFRIEDKSKVEQGTC